MSIRDFTDEEMNLLSRVIKREKQAIQNTPSRPTQDRSYDENQDWLAPEVYIAKPTEDIPARVDDQAGFATADVYRISVDGSGNPNLIKAFESGRRIHNIFGSTISRGYVTIVRDKYGNWIAITGGTTLVRATVTERTRNQGTGTGTEGFTGTGTGTGVGDPNTPVAIYRTSHPQGFNIQLYICDPGTGTADIEDLLCYADTLTGVVYTDKAITVYIDQCGDWQVIDGEDYWSDAVTQEDIQEGSSGLVELFAGGPIVTAYSDTSIASGTSCDVEFDTQAQIFKITAQGCQPNP